MSKEKLLERARRRFKTVDIEGDTFTVSEMSAATFSLYGETVKTQREEAHAVLLQDCVVDGQGLKLLTIEEARDVARSARIVLPLVTAIMEVSGLSAEEKPNAS